MQGAGLAVPRHPTAQRAPCPLFVGLQLGEGGHLDEYGWLVVRVGAEGLRAHTTQQTLRRLMQVAAGPAAVTCQHGLTLVQPHLCMRMIEVESGTSL